MRNASIWFVHKHSEKARLSQVRKAVHIEQKVLAQPTFHLELVRGKKVTALVALCKQEVQNDLEIGHLAGKEIWASSR